MTTHAFLGLIPGIPLAGALIIFLGLPVIHSKKYLRFVARFSIIASVLFAGINVIQPYVSHADRSYIAFTFNNWLRGEQVGLHMTLYASPFSLFPLIMIGLFSLFLIIVLSHRQPDEHHELRLTRYVVLFYALSTILLISGSFVLTFFAWSSLGIVMFLLTHDRFLTMENQSGTRLMLMRFLLFDFLLLMGLFLLLIEYRTLDYLRIFQISAVVPNSPMTGRLILAGILIIVGISGRLPLFPFSGWLMHTKKIPRIVQLYLYTTILPLGIYLILRLSFFLDRSRILLLLMGVMAGLSIIFGVLKILLQTYRNHLSPSVMLILVGCSVLFASLGIVYYTYLLWLFIICLLPFILIPRGFAAVNPDEDELSSLAEDQPGLYLAVRDNFRVDEGLDLLLIQPIRKVADLLWTADTWLNRFFSDGLRLIFRKWGELSLFFDTYLITGFPGKKGFSSGEPFFRIFLNREFYNYLVLVICLILVLAICVIVI